MKIVAVYGSDRAGSVSAKVVDQILAGAKDAGHEIVTYHVCDPAVFGCRACGACKKNGQDCCICDGLQSYWQDLREAGTLILAIPVYMGQASGQMVSFMNRHYCLRNSMRKLRMPEGKSLVTVFSQGAPSNYEKYQPAQDWYVSCFTQMGMHAVANIVVGGDSDLNPDGDEMKSVYAFGKDL
ncbi:MAG: flavodoxin family protein [Oscillospiraceae bacterium]|nr:flavodoxin family protein [Oscillospiraceae bacterium]